MNMIRIAAIGLAAALAGCAQQRQAKLEADFTNCQARFPTRPAVRLAACFNEALQANVPGMNGLYLIQTTFMKIAAKVDKNEITQEEAEAEMARVMFDIEQADQARIDRLLRY